MEKQIFYYKFNKVNAWLILNLALTITLSYWSIKCVCLLYWIQTQILIGLCVFSWLGWIWKYVLKHQAIMVDEEGIKLDLSDKLKWSDIKSIEEKEVCCCLKKYKVLILHPKENIGYHYNFLQKHNGEFTPFAVPLYGILSEDDEKTVVEIIKQKVGIEHA